jgi:alpha-tubulin suppressor-like RCC1 family protein
VHKIAHELLQSACRIMPHSSTHNDVVQVEATEIWKPTCEANEVIKICSGTDHVVALCRSKTVLTWGSGQQGQLGRVGTRVARRGHTLLDAYLVPAAMHLPFRMQQPADIAAGHYVSYVILSNGEVYSCGLNNYGQLGIPSSITEPVCPASGPCHALCCSMLDQADC